jgi:hypothetical protein
LAVSQAAKQEGGSLPLSLLHRLRATVNGALAALVQQPSEEGGDTAMDKVLASLRLLQEASRLVKQVKARSAPPTSAAGGAPLPGRSLAEPLSDEASRKVTAMLFEPPKKTDDTQPTHTGLLPKGMGWAEGEAGSPTKQVRPSHTTGPIDRHVQGEKAHLPLYIHSLTLSTCGMCGLR